MSLSANCVTSMNLLQQILDLLLCAKCSVKQPNKWYMGHVQGWPSLKDSQPRGAVTAGKMLG